jgi:hypothetical protein
MSVDSLPIHRVFARLAPLVLAALLCACGHNNNTSGYGLAWVTVQSEPSPDFAAYNITIDSITLIRNDGVTATAIGTPEIVDFTQQGNIAELWGSGAIPIGTYVSAQITFDYTNAVIAVKQNGKAVQAKVLDAHTAAAPTTYSVSVNFDPAHQLVVTPTYASTSAHLLAINFDLAASSIVDFTKSPATVSVQPYVTVGVLRPDTRTIRVRGPLLNSSGDVQTYSVYVRPFYDEANNIGNLALFTRPGTVWTLNGKTYIGSAGLAALAGLSAGITSTVGYAQFVPDFNTLNQAAAGTFYLSYVVAGSTLEDQYTEGVSGEVVARSGNTLTLMNATLFLNTADEFLYQFNPATVLVGSGTLVTADNNRNATALDASSIAVGQHITARGLYSLNASNEAIIDATGTTSTNTGSVRLQATELFGPLISEAPGSLVMNVEDINGWPVSDYNFTGNGATAPSPGAFAVSTGTLALPAGTAAGDPVWVDGYVAPFGHAPPDFDGTLALNNETSIQMAGIQAGGGPAYSAGPIGVCPQSSQICEPASMEVIWAGTGTGTPFESGPAAGTGNFSLSLTGATLARLWIGPEVIDMTTLPSSPTVEGLPPASYASFSTTFAPRYSAGDPLTSSTTPSLASTTFLTDVSDFVTFTTDVKSVVTSANTAKRFVAHGVWNRTLNTFTAASIDFVL